MADESNLLSQIANYGVVVPAASAVGLWFGTRIAETISSWIRRRRERVNLIRALFAEVDFNTKDLYVFGAMSAATDQIEKRFQEKPDAVIHVTDAHHTLIYTENIDKLHYLDDRFAARLVLFYGLLDKIKAQIDGISLSSFAAVTPAGKLSVVNTLLANVEECEGIGREILNDFSKAYPKLGLVRTNRAMADTKQR